MYYDDGKELKDLPIKIF